MILIFTFYVIIAGVMIFGKTLGAYSTFSFLAAVRLIPAGIIFLFIDYLKHKKLKLPTFKSRDFVLLMAYCATIFFVDATRLKGLSFIPSSNAALVSMMAPFIAVLLSWKFFGEHITRRKIGALCLGVIGVLPLVISHMSLDNESFMAMIFGYSFILLATLGIIISGMFAKYFIAKRGYRLFTITGFVMIGGGSLGLINSLLYDVWAPVPLSNFSVSVPLICLLLVFHSLIAFPLYSYLVQKYPITLVSFAQCIMPFLTAVIAWFLTGETISYMFFASLCILVLSLYVFYQEELKEGLIKN